MDIDLGKEKAVDALVELSKHATTAPSGVRSVTPPEVRLKAAKELLRQWRYEQELFSDDNKENDE